MNLNKFLEQNEKQKWIMFRQDETKVTIQRVEKMHFKVTTAETNLVIHGFKNKTPLALDTSITFLTGEEVSRILNWDEDVIKNIFEDSQMKVTHSWLEGSQYSIFREAAVGIGLFLVSVTGERKQIVYDFAEDKTLTLLTSCPATEKYQPEAFELSLNGVVASEGIHKMVKKLFYRPFCSIRELLK